MPVNCVFQWFWCEWLGLGLNLKWLGLEHLWTWTELRWMLARLRLGLIGFDYFTGRLLDWINETIAGLSKWWRSVAVWLNGMSLSFHLWQMAVEEFPERIRKGQRQLQISANIWVVRVYQRSIECFSLWLVRTCVDTWFCDLGSKFKKKPVSGDWTIEGGWVSDKGLGSDRVDLHGISFINLSRSTQLLMTTWLLITCHW